MELLTLIPTFLALSLLTLLSASTNQTLTADISALTAVKLSLFDPLASLSGWDPSSPSAPCDWRGVTCSSVNRHVTELSLPRLGLSGPLSHRISDLRFLRRLSLRFNSFNGSLPTSFPRYLRVLDLSANSFSGDFPADLPASSPELELINLSHNNLTGGIPATLGGLQGLKYLWLDSNQLSGPIPAAIGNCSALVHFSADGNSLVGVIPAGLPALPELQVISLSRNDLSGTIPSSVFCNFFGVSVSPSLRIVHLGFNGFTEMGAVMSKCYSVLRVLDLQENKIHGALPAWLGNLSSIVKLDLSGNMFLGPIPRGISNLFNLEELRLRNNSLSGNLPVQIRNCSALEVIDLGDNKFSGEIPAFLSDIRGLKSLFLGGNQFSGRIPASFGDLTRVQALDVGDNELSGLLPVELFGLSNLTTLNLAGNNFSGPIPPSIGNLKQLIVLNLSGNGFSGVIPESLGNLYKLITLDLSKQDLRGELPLELLGLPNLQVVALQENKLNGDVPQGFSSLLGLTYLNLSSNNFTGNVPSTFGYLKSMVVLSLSNNYISGAIPPEIGNCSSLQVLEFGSNSLDGHIPSDISHLSHLTKLDLSRNNLSGEIPEQLSNCSALDSLFLDGNHLSGIIPLSLSNLFNLTTLDLSQNDLVGEIPQNLTAIPALTHFNVSGNNLQGEIPQALGLRFSDQSVFAGNQYLCGKPLDMKCESLKKDGKTRLVWLLVVSIAGTCLLVLFCCFYIFSVLRWRKRLKEGATKEKKRSPARASSGTGTASHRGSSDSSTGPKLVMFNNKITLSETIEATRNFDEENVLSRTKYGLVFKASYNDGTVLAIRRLSGGSLSENAFKKEAEALGKVKHRNLTVLRGYYSGPPNLRLLVHDYMPNGNLATLLQEASHQDGHVLNWPMRHLIALGVARGLAFLHTSHMVHGDVKPQNVLFDADFEAHLSDFGLDKLIVVNSGEPSTSTPPSVGYMCPEVGNVTKESDVYSFGIVLLELLTGKRPVMFTEDEDIVKWVKRQLQRGQINELLEPRLLELDPESSEWEELLLGIKVALLCTATDPIDRPTMPDVVFMLEGCRVGPDIPSSADPSS